MKQLLPALFLAQKLLLVSSYWISRVVIRPSRHNSIDWVVGPVEVASVVRQFSRAIPNSFSVSLRGNPYYDHKYDYMYQAGRRKRLQSWHNLIFAPILLGRLAVLARGFLYVAASGFLIDRVDHRDFEFRFLKARGRKIGTFWCGSEIRSPALCAELEESLGIPNIFSYIGQITPSLLTAEHENVLRQRAKVGDAYADIMFDSPTDQRSYLTTHSEPNVFLMGPEQFAQGRDKFAELSTPVVVHASTSPIIKGTQLVRAAVARLREEGYSFEYTELIKMSHDQVIEAMGRAHIALNQFYGFTTTVFGVEAMAAHCAVLSSSDETIETTLAPGVNEAVLVTKHWQVYEHLKFLLDNPDKIEPIADAGRNWALHYASLERTGPRVSALLESVLNGSYNASERALLTNAELHGGERSSAGLI